MTGMNVWKRATLAIVRKPVRSGIIGLLMLMVFTSLVAQVGASTALQKMSDDIGGSLEWVLPSTPARIPSAQRKRAGSHASPA